jgi:hypothetical protein
MDFAERIAGRRRDRLWRLHEPREYAAREHSNAGSAQLFLG